MQEKDFVIRAASADDAPKLAPLATELGYSADEAETAERLRRVLETPDHHVLVAEAPAPEIVGWVHVFGTVRVQSDGFAELGGLVVASKWRRRGAGSALVTAAERWASDNGYPRLRIRSRVERTDAHRFFEGQGFAGRKTQRVFEGSVNRKG